MTESVSPVEASPLGTGEWIACRSCDQLLHVPVLKTSERADCPTCGQVLSRGRPDSIQRTLALSLSAIILYGVTQSTTFMTFELQGRTQEAKIITGILELFADGKLPLASLILVTAVVAPFCWTAALLYASLPLTFKVVPPGIVSVLRWCQIAQDWSMLEVLMLAVIVTYVKLATLAHLGFGPGAMALIPLLLALTAAGDSFERAVFWRRLEQLRQ
ncbi:MAG: paraquat-inducible protein A [Myxococcota bacterium]|nr:paraquat-inducible protein A [Myxococcota bacterium]